MPLVAPEPWIGLERTHPARACRVDISMHVGVAFIRIAHVIQILATSVLVSTWNGTGAAPGEPARLKDVVLSSRTSVCRAMRRFVAQGAKGRWAYTKRLPLSLHAFPD